MSSPRNRDELAGAYREGDEAADPVARTARDVAVADGHRHHEERADGERAAAAGLDVGAAVRDEDPDAVVVSVVMPTVSWTGTFAACGRRALALVDESACPAEFVVVFDGPAPTLPAWLDRPGVKILSTGQRAGPATARNMAAGAAAGRILFFVDADVELDPESLSRVAAAFASDPDLVAIFGAYDDEPAAEGAVSQFRNLLHHHTHVVHPGRADTFWSGCGAIRAREFQDVGGFDENYAFPSVEDIELGMRISTQSGKIVLDPGLKCKHLKQWTFPSMLVADVFYRAMPWTHLIMQTHRLPATLNIDWKGRLSGATSLLLVACVAITPLVPMAVWGAIAAAAALVGMNFGFYRLCLRKRGFGFAASSVALHCLYFLYSSITFAVVVIQETLRGTRRSTACRFSPSSPPVTEPATSSVAISTPSAR